MEVPSRLKKQKINELKSPIIIPSLLPKIKPDKNIIRVNNSIFGRNDSKYPKTIAKAVNVPISEIRRDFFSNQTELLTLSVSIFSALLLIIVCVLLRFLDVSELRVIFLLSSTFFV